MFKLVLYDDIKQDNKCIQVKVSLIDNVEIYKTHIHIGRLRTHLAVKTNKQINNKKQKTEHKTHFAEQ